MVGNVNFYGDFRRFKTTFPSRTRRIPIGRDVPGSNYRLLKRVRSKGRSLAVRKKYPLSPHLISTRFKRIRVTNQGTSP